MIGQVKAKRLLFVRIGFGWSTSNDALPQAERDRVVAGALMEDPAWLRDESFDLDLTGSMRRTLERLLARADSEAGPDEANSRAGHQLGS